MKFPHVLPTCFKMFPHVTSFYINVLQLTTSCLPQFHIISHQFTSTKSTFSHIFTTSSYLQRFPNGHLVSGRSGRLRTQRPPRHGRSFSDASGEAPQARRREGARAPGAPGGRRRLRAGGVRKMIIYWGALS